MSRIYNKLSKFDLKTNPNLQSKTDHGVNLPRMLKEKKKEAKCPKRSGEIYKDYYGKDHSKRCRSKCKPHWKLKDYIEALNNIRTGDGDFEKKCKKLLLDPLIKKAKVPKWYGKKYENKKPYKNCNMGNHVFINGKKGSKKFIKFLKRVKKRKLKKLTLDPCQSYMNYKHAKYMAKSKCLTHSEHWQNKTPVNPEDEQCQDFDDVTTKGKRMSWRKRALEYGNFGSGVEIVGTINEKSGWNPTLFTCMLALDDQDPEKTNRAQLFKHKFNNAGFGVFKRGRNIYYSLTLTDIHVCKHKYKRRITRRKKEMKLICIEKEMFKDEEDKEKKIVKKRKNKFKNFFSFLRL